MEEKDYLTAIDEFNKIINRLAIYSIQPGATDALVAKNIKPEDEIYGKENNLIAFVKQIEGLKNIFLSDKNLLYKYMPKIVGHQKQLNYYAQGYRTRHLENYQKHLLPALTKLNDELRRANIRIR